MEGWRKVGSILVHRSEVSFEKEASDLLHSYTITSLWRPNTLFSPILSHLFYPYLHLNHHQQLVYSQSLYMSLH